MPRARSRTADVTRISPDLAGACARARTVDDGADRGEVAMRLTRIAKVGLAESIPIPMPSSAVALADLLEQHLAARGEALLYLAGGEQRMRGMILLLDGKLKIASTASPIVLLSKPVMCQIAAAAVVVEGVEQRR